jgi:hypothetical protein
MYPLLMVLLAFQTATVIDVYGQSCVTLAVQLGNTIYTAEFSRRELGPNSFQEGEKVRAETKDGKLIIQRKDGKVVSSRIIRIQIILAHPLPCMYVFVN